MASGTVRRRSRAVWFALVVSIAVAGCGFGSVLEPTDELVGCTLEPVTGTFDVVDGFSVIRNPVVFGPLRPDPLPVQWPKGWQLRDGPTGVQVIDRHGKLQATAGQQVAVYAKSDNGSPMIERGVLLACPQDVIQGAWPPPA